MARLSTLTISIRDDKRKIRRFALNLSSPVAITQPQEDPLEYASILVDLINPLINGQIMGASLTTRVPFTQQPSLSISDVEEGAIFAFETDSYSRVSFRIPTFNESFCIPGSQKIDDSIAEIDALVRALEIPVDLYGTQCFVSDNRGVAVLRFKEAYFQFKP